MHVELCVVQGCPHAATALTRLREALTALGRSRTPVTTTVIVSQQMSEARGFTGSPSFLVDGRDVLASSGPAAVACRIYRGEDATEGLPTLQALAEAIRRSTGEAVTRPG
jgi:hypothetical protein